MVTQPHSGLDCTLQWDNRNFHWHVFSSIWIKLVSSPTPFAVCPALCLQHPDSIAVFLYCSTIPRTSLSRCSYPKLGVCGARITSPPVNLSDIFSFSVSSSKINTPLFSTHIQMPKQQARFSKWGMYHSTHKFLPIEQEHKHPIYAHTSSMYVKMPLGCQTGHTLCTQACYMLTHLPVRAHPTLKV